MQNSKQRRNAIAASILIALAAYGGSASAQVFNDVSVKQKQDATVTVTIEFNSKVRFKQSVVAPSNLVATVFFDITGADTLSPGVVEESRKWSNSLLVPEFTTRYSKQSGQPTERRLDVSFASPVEILQISPGLDDQSIVLTLSAASIRAAQPDAGATARPSSRGSLAVTLPPSPALSAAATSDDEKSRQNMLISARNAAESRDFDRAIADLNRLLNLPPGFATQDAQELIGYVREMIGDNKRALAEYELYLKLYPDGDGAKRISTRIAAMGAAGSDPASGETAERKPTMTMWGGVSQYYYGGNSKIRDEFTIITPATGATEIDVQNISTVDQSALVTDVNYNIRYRTADWDNRFTFRDTFRYSFLDTQASRNRLSSAYVDLRNEKMHFGTRLGRQVAASGGVLGRFDGGIFTYGFGSSRFRAGLGAGQLVEPGLGGDKRFIGMTFDAENVIENLGIEMFAIQQNADGETDRRAVGGEIRYFDPKFSVFSLFDYDILFSELNIASVQGNWNISPKASMNFLYDYRRSPSLQMSNALLGETETSLSELQLTMTKEEIEAQALGLTPVSKVAMLGGAYTVSPKWQLSADYRLSSVSGTIATANLPASPDTGQVKTISAHAIGTGLFTPSGVLVFNTSYLTSAAYDAWLFGITSRFRVGPNWIIEPGLKYYRQDNAIGSVSKRLTPVGRLTYQLREHIALEAEVNLEKTKTTAALNNEDATSLFYYIGYRYDF
jgi:tetratricopeptide (TPR) repeat protein